MHFEQELYDDSRFLTFLVISSPLFHGRGKQQKAQEAGRLNWTQLPASLKNGAAAAAVVIEKFPQIFVAFAAAKTNKVDKSGACASASGAAPLLQP